MMTPEEMMQSDLLVRYVEGELNDGDRRAVEEAAAKDPRVAQALDMLRRAKVDHVLSHIRAANPQTFIESGILEAYAFGEFCEEKYAKDRLEIELMAFIHPSVKEELEAIEAMTERLVNKASIVPPLSLKTKVLTAIDAAEKEDQADSTQPPILNALSKADDYSGYVNKGNSLVPPSYDNLFIVPMNFSEAALTMFVCVKEYIEEEVHLDSIEKFLVLEGACRIEMDHETVDLYAGDYLSIPKFTRHTVFVTSTGPCKLIVQQVAA